MKSNFAARFRGSIPLLDSVARFRGSIPWLFPWLDSVADSVALPLACPAAGKFSRASSAGGRRCL
ncbi:MAG: hypothetical protein O3B75_06710 [Planctomycetota bacterium]|nr:hypothetical protein [Planctomycetota bacterium]